MKQALNEQHYKFWTIYFLTHWGRVMHICASKLTHISSDNGLSPSRLQAIIWTNAGILIIRPLGTNSSEIIIKIHIFLAASVHPSVCPSHLFTQGQFWVSGIVITCVCVCVRVCVCQSVCHSLACPCDNLGPVQARIAKFGPKMQKTLVKVPIGLGGNWPWPSRPNLTLKSEFTPFWACPDHNSLHIQVRITKFGPEVENSLVKVPIILGGNWPWPSRSNLI